MRLVGRLALALLVAAALFVGVGMWEAQRLATPTPPTAIPLFPSPVGGYPAPAPETATPVSYPLPPTPPLPDLAAVAYPTPPTPTAIAPPSPSPSPSPTASPTPTVTPTATAAPATPTPSRTPRPVSQADLAEPIFIESLRRKPPHAGDIELLSVWEERPAFIRFTMRYLSEGQRVTGYINIPRGSGPFPVIVMNHGYFLQERYTPGMGTLREADYLAERGYVVAVPDFRSYAGSDAGVDGGGHFGLDWVYDSLNLMDAVKRLPTVDPTRLGVWGHSTGGLNALQATVTRTDIRATVVVSTMSPDMTQTLVFLRAWRPWVADEVVRHFGTPQAKPDTWARMSPIHYLADASGPVQVHHGLADEEVTPQFSARLWAAMQAAGTPGEVYTYPGVGHLWQQPDAWRLMMDRTAAFYDRYLKTGIIQ